MFRDDDAFVKNVVFSFLFVTFGVPLRAPKKQQIVGQRLDVFHDAGRERVCQSDVNVVQSVAEYLE